jgi:hypothetical protein
VLNRRNEAIYGGKEVENMATAVGTKETHIAKNGEGIIRADPTTTVAPQTVKAKSLAALLEMTAKVQEDAGITALFQIYDLEATYDIETGVWTGRLGKA